MDKWIEILIDFFFFCFHKIAKPLADAPGTMTPLPPPPPGHQIHAGVVQPTTVRAVEQAYFKQHQYIQQIRPLAEVLGGGNFYFLQDSELDSPEVPNANVTPHPTADRQPNVQIGVRNCLLLIEKKFFCFSFKFYFFSNRHLRHHLSSQHNHNPNNIPLVIYFD